MFSGGRLILIFLLLTVWPHLVFDNWLRVSPIVEGAPVETRADIRGPRSLRAIRGRSMGSYCFLVLSSLVSTL